MYLLGYDIGSSSIKAAIVAIDSQATIDVVRYPDIEMDIVSHQLDWAEQDPQLWWQYLCEATKKILARNPNIRSEAIKGIGISYQMHGLVLVDKDQQILRPAIIWCDSRAVDIGATAFKELGEQHCLETVLNSPGNFTASKLNWVKENEPEIFERVDKFMLPGDYIAMKLTGVIGTTISGLSEGVLWDFKHNRLAHDVLNYFGIPDSMVPDIVPTFGHQGTLTATASAEMELGVGIPIAYRAGDQPNNALSLDVLNPGEIAATGGTSGVIYGISDQLVYDKKSRVNAFAHVNHKHSDPRIGILLCINGAGIQYSWLKQQIAGEGTTYECMENLIKDIPINSDGLRIIPFGNGAERILGNKNIGSHIVNINFNRHQQAHIFRASLEGIAFSFIYGIDILKEMGLAITSIKVGSDNLFQSKVFSETISNLLSCTIDVVQTTGAVGAAKAAGIATGHYIDLKEANGQLEIINHYHPTNLVGAYQDAYGVWKNDLEIFLT